MVWCGGGVIYTLNRISVIVFLCLSYNLCLNAYTLRIVIPIGRKSSHLWVEGGMEKDTHASEKSHAIVEIERYT